MSFLDLGKSKINIAIFVLFLLNVICAIFIFFVINPKFSLKGLLVATKLQSLCINCNVIMVSLDTLSANHLPCYGYERNTSPNLCSFARSNIIFSNAYANASWTLPSHVSVFTGLFPFNHGVNRVTDVLSLDKPFLTDTLRLYGYNILFFIPPNGTALPVDTVYKRVGTGLFSNDEDDWNKSIEMFKNSVRSNKKTFMFLHTYDVHAPYNIYNQDYKYPVSNKSIPSNGQIIRQITPDFVDYFISIVKYGLDADSNWKYYSKESSIYFTKLLEVYPDYPKCIEIINSILDKFPSIVYNYLFDFNYAKAFNKNTPEDVESLRSLYDQTINILDDNKIPLLTNLIEDPEFKDNTILIIFSDHGEEFMEHGHLFHETVYDSSIRVPLIMHIPNLSNIKITNQVQLVDLFPTILDILGIKTNSLLDGKGLINKILSLDNKNDFIVADGLEMKNKALIDWPWKLFLARQVNGAYIPYELYNISKDPGETNNILFGNTKIKDTLIKKYPYKLN
jgi:arylsulfatase A-like enzyme